MEGREDIQNPIIWWKDIKFLIGISLVLSSFILGFVGKGIFIAKFSEPVGRYTGLSLWGLSWLLMITGILLFGIETIRMIKLRIQQAVKKKVKGTYTYTKTLPGKGMGYTRELHKKGVDYTKELHRKSVEKIGPPTARLIQRIRH